MLREIRTFGGHFERFIADLPDKAREKVDYCLQVLKYSERVSAKFVKHIRDGVFELRIEHSGNIYRVFFIFDDGNIVVLFNGFTKKTQKTPNSEIEKAMRIKASYYKEKYG